QKLTGRFVLVRRGQDDSGKSNWLLLHKDDEHARPGWNPEEHPRSVKSDRTNEEVAAEPEAVWHGDRPADQAEVPLPRAESSGRGRKPAAKKSKKATTASARQSWPEPTEEELAALDQMSAKGTWQLAGQQLRVTNLDKVLFPGGGDAPGITKRGADPLLHPGGPGDAPLSQRAPVEHAPLPQRGRAEGVLAQGD